LFAVLNLTFADSVIAFYDAKYHFLVWRPITAIRLGDTIDNPAITGDASWTPLAVTAADPSYPGAHSTVSAAGASVLSDFFGSHGQIDVTSDAVLGTVGPSRAIARSRLRRVSVEFVCLTASRLGRKRYACRILRLTSLTALSASSNTMS